MGIYISHNPHSSVGDVLSEVEISDMFVAIKLNDISSSIGATYLERVGQLAQTILDFGYK